LKDETTRNAADSAETNMAGGAHADSHGGDLRVPVGTRNGDRQDVDRGVSRAVSVEAGTEGDYSPKPRKSRKPKASKPLTSREIASEQVVDLAAFKASATIHSSAVFDADKWKRSRIKKGYLIARIEGYDPVESEYGVHYLKVISRNPKKTSGDCSRYEHAGFATWKALQAVGRLVKERNRYERIAGDGANAS
jgi:hypothetical protein